MVDYALYCVMYVIMLNLLRLSVVMCLFLSSCQDSNGRDKAARAKVEPQLTELLTKQNLKFGSPVFIRAIKEDSVLELWMKPEGKDSYVLVKSYPIAKWSGELGPKMKEGDGQTPEGFYRTTLKDLNPKSKFHLSFNIGYPNSYDRFLGRTGSFIMVHGSNASIGCLAMTDEGIEEIYSLVEAGLRNGQASVPVQIYPFVPSEVRLQKETDSPHYEFWKTLQKSWDYTEKNKMPAPNPFPAK